MVQRKAGSHPDSDRLGERYWNGEAWEGFRVRNRDLWFVVTSLIWMYLPIAVVWIASLIGDFKRPSVGVRVASVVIGILALIPIGRALTQAITITRTAVADRRIVRTRRCRLERVEDAFRRETRLGNELTLRLRGEEPVALGDLDYRPERRRACVAEIRRLLPCAPAVDRSPLCDPTIPRSWRTTPATLRERRDSARVGDVASDERATLLMAAVLVYMPRVSSTAVDVFDQDANCLGSVIQVFGSPELHTCAAGGWSCATRRSAACFGAP